MAAKNNDQVDSIIGEGSTFEGQFHVQGSLRVNGKFQGDVRVGNELIVGETGKVKTNISARRVIVAGTFVGNIEASEEVILLSSGQVLGNITSPVLNVHKGVVTVGEVQITSSPKDQKRLAEMIEKSFSAEPFSEKEKKAQESVK